MRKFLETFNEHTAILAVTSKTDPWLCASSFEHKFYKFSREQKKKVGKMWLTFFELVNVQKNLISLILFGKTFWALGALYKAKKLQ